MCQETLVWKTARVFQSLTDIILTNRRVSTLFSPSIVLLSAVTNTLLIGEVFCFYLVKFCFRKKEVGWNKFWHIFKKRVWFFLPCFFSPTSFMHFNWEETHIRLTNAQMICYFFFPRLLNIKSIITHVGARAMIFNFVLLSKVQHFWLITLH